MINFFTRTRCLILSVLMSATFCLSMFSIALAQTASAGVNPRPKLVVLLVADQFASNYLSFSALVSRQPMVSSTLLENGGKFHRL